MQTCKNKSKHIDILTSLARSIENEKWMLNLRDKCPNLDLIKNLTQEIEDHIKVEKTDRTKLRKTTMSVHELKKTRFERRKQFDQNASTHSLIENKQK